MAAGNPWPSTTYVLRHGGGESGNFAFADGHAKAENINMACTNTWADATNIYCVELDQIYYCDVTRPPS